MTLLAHGRGVTKRCNSAYFGSENPVSDMFEAVSRLGFYEVYRVVVVISGARTMAGTTAAAVLPLELLRGGIRW